MAGFQFGEFEFDPARHALFRAGERIHVRPTPLRLLRYLLEHANRVVPQAELMQRVWADTAVSGWALTTALRELRIALGDDGRKQRWVLTERNHGLRFRGPVSRTATADGSSTATLGSHRLYGIARGLSMSFVGRLAELDRLASLLTDDALVALQVSIEGLAGIGKTELALQLTHALAARRHFRGGIFWLDAEAPDLTSAWGGLIADQVGIPEGSHEVRCRELMRRLAAREEPVLLVLDNVSSWEPAARPHPLPVGPHIRVLSTTRIRNLGGALYKHASLGPLSKESSRELLLSLAGQDPGADLDGLLESLGGHPLALELAGAYLGTRLGETAASCLEVLQRDPRALEEISRGRTRYEQTLDQALTRVWDQLAGSEREAWCIAAQFHPAPARRRLAEAAGIDSEAFHGLEELHLLQCDRHGLWSMHRVVRAFAHRHAPDALRARSQRAFLLACAASAERMGESMGFFVFYEDAVQFEAAIALCEDRDDLAEVELRLLLGVGASTRTQQSYSVRQTHRGFERSIELATRIGGHRLLREILGRYWVHHNVRHDLERLAEMSLRTEQVAVDLQRPELHVFATAMRAVALLTDGRVTQARQLFEGALEACEQGSGAEVELERIQGPIPLMIWTGGVRLLTGEFSSGRALIEEGVRLAGERLGLMDRVLTSVAAMVFYHLAGAAHDVARHAHSPAEIGATRELPLIRNGSAALQAWSRIMLGPRGGSEQLERLRDLEVCTTRLDALQFGCLKATRESCLTDARLRLGMRQAALENAQRTLEIAERNREHVFLSELFRQRAHCWESADRTRRDLERAIAVAEEQGASLYRLRAATDAVHANAGTPGERAARDRLRHIVASFPDTSWVDVQRAQQILDSSTTADR